VDFSQAFPEAQKEKKFKNLAEKLTGVDSVLIIFIKRPFA